MNLKSTVHFSTLCFTTRAVFEDEGRASLADITTLGFVISLVTSASVAIADCFFVLLLLIDHDFTPCSRLKVNLDHAASLLVLAAILNM